ncbi:TRADD-N-associated membrane domain-containing protein [Streptomyces sp. DT24]|uniref:TRADD-N-associated membrane domain-containing protein n=1 Tax=Streptomyces sp. DT24 TaxID=3416520 RepID=UPI003CEF0628
MELLIFLMFGIALSGLVAVGFLIQRVTRRILERDRKAVARDLRSTIFGGVTAASGGTANTGIRRTDDATTDSGSVHTSVSGTGVSAPSESSAAQERPLAAQQRIDDDRFAELLVQRYAYGLTQSQRSFLASQVFSVLGGAILLTGVGLAIWRAETSDGLYASVVTTAAGIVTTVIGRLFHRESDKALKHMASETDALRDDMRAERSAEQAILLLAEVEDPETKARLQAGLIMSFAGSEMPTLRDAPLVPASRMEEESSSGEQ